MRRLICLSVVLLPAQAFALEASDLYGTWKLVSSKTKLLDTGEELDTLGSKPHGILTYTADGRMVSVATSSDRPNAASAAKLADADRAKLFNTMWAYAGTFTVQGQSVTHHVDTSWNEYWNGMNLTRDVKLQGDKLLLTTKPQHSVFHAGRMEVVSLVWERVK